MENYDEWTQIERRKIDYILSFAGEKKEFLAKIDLNNTTNKHEENYKFITNLYSSEFEMGTTKDNEFL